MSHELHNSYMTLMNCMTLIGYMILWLCEFQITEPMYSDLALYIRASFPTSFAFSSSFNINFYFQIMSTQASSLLSELPSSLLSEFDYSDIFTSTPIMILFDLYNSSPLQNALPSSTLDSLFKAMDSDFIHRPRTC